MSTEEYILTISVTFLIQFIYMITGSCVYLILDVDAPTIKYNKDKPRHPNRIVVTAIANFFIRYLFLQFWIVFPFYALVIWYSERLKEYKESRGL